jgi:phospholipid/cholesterol/gamma-HCH transport system substrate-binding protein
MTRESRAWIIRRRLYGVGFITLLVSLLTLSVMSYQQVFTKVTLVTLDTDHTGAQLLKQSDVKIRGIIVGQVRKISTYTQPGKNGAEPETRARLQLALNPSQTKLIPRGATALLLPKTLFGERYVALQIPENLAGDLAEPIRAGDTISGGQDSIELERVLDDLYPVLLALHPEQLKATLTALADALQGRGKQLGDNLASLNSYLQKLNPRVPALVDDLDKLGKVAMLYNDAAPDLIGTLNNLQTTAKTITSRTSALDELLKSATGTSNELQGFLNDNGDYLIQVAASGSQILKLLAHYSPEYPCLLKGLADSEPALERAFGGGQPALHITLEIVKSQGKYVPGDEPQWPNAPSLPGPHCFGLPNPLVPFPGVDFPDGAGASDGAAYSNQQGTADRSAYHANGVGSPAERGLVAALISSSFGGNPADVPAIATQLAAPLLRGSEVTVK